MSVADARPWPPRYWWLKRIAAGVLILSGVATAGYLWTIHRSEKLLGQRIDAAHAAGRLILLKDFQYQPLADESNAAAIYMTVAGISKLPEDIEILYSLDELKTFDAQHPGELDAIFAQNQPAFEAVQRTHGLDVYWDCAGKPVCGHLTRSRKLGKLLAKSALWRLLRDDPTGALMQVDEVLRLAEATERNHPAMIAAMVARAIRELGIDALGDVLPCISRLHESFEADTAIAIDEHLKNIMVRLLDEDPQRRAFEQGFDGEVALLIDEFEKGRGGSSAWMPRGNIARVLAPYFWLVELRELNYRLSASQAVREDLFPRARRQFPAELHPHDMDFLGQVIHWNASSIPFLNYAGLARRRMAAIAIAITLHQRLYGWRPASLEQLAPEFLRQVPVDPFTADAAPFRYAPDADPARLYSIGEDGIDDGGEGQRLGQPGGGRRPDCVFYLGCPE